MAFAIGAERPDLQRISKTASNAPESDVPSGITGFTSSTWPPNASDTMRISWLFIQFLLPRTVLISPLCAIIRKGCANDHWGKVLVE